MTRDRRRSVAVAVLVLLLAALTASPAQAAAPPRPPGCTGADISATRGDSTAISASGTPTITSTLNVAFAQEITDVDVITNLAHSFPGDIDMTLTSPAGTVVTLTTDNASGNDNVFDGTRWDDQADPGGQVPYANNAGLVTDHPYAINVPVPTLAPEEPLSAFYGESSGGVWTLRIHDDASGDGGSLDGWSLRFDQPTSAVVQTSSVLVANTTNRALADGGVATRSDIVVSGAGSHLTDTNLLASIEHTNSGDLDVTLRSPAGTVATVTTDNGGTMDDVFDGVAFDDRAGPDGQVPYPGDFNQRMITDRDFDNGVAVSPASPEESFGVFNGENPNGTWRLTVVDDMLGNTGRLDDWALLLKSGHCGSFQPDGRIKRGASGALAGNGVYNANGASQTRTGSAPPGGTVTYFVSVQNDSPTAQALRVRGGRSGGAFLITYRSPAGTNITGAVTGAGYRTPVLAAGATHVVKVQVQVRANAAPGATLTRAVTSLSVVDPGSRDVVKYRTSRS